MSYMPMNIFMAAIDNMVFLTFPFGLLLLLNFFFLREIIPLLTSGHNTVQQK